jgi:tRNA (adenine37-N6)-methyltransferase
MNTITFNPIGVIHSIFKQPEGTPIQPGAGQGVEGQVEVWPEYADGLQGLAGFSHIILLYHCHMAKPFTLKVTPFMDDQEHGLFATRAPSRPNSIGLSIVHLVAIDGVMLHIQDMDILDGTPLLDIKPYVPAFDQHQQVRIGWLEKRVGQLSKTKDDGRFVLD